MVAMEDMVDIEDMVDMEDIVESDRLILKLNQKPKQLLLQKLMPIPKPTMDMVVTEVDTEAMAVTEDMVDIVANDLPTPMLIMDTGAMGVAMEVMVDMADMVDTVARDLQMPMPIMAMEAMVVIIVDMDMAVKINIPKDIQSPKTFFISNYIYKMTYSQNCDCTQTIRQPQKGGEFWPVFAASR